LIETATERDSVRMARTYQKRKLISIVCNGFVPKKVLVALRFWE